MKRILYFIPRFLFSLTFITSGTLKMTDPVGTGLIVSEYLRTFHLDFMLPAADWIGILLATAEASVGVALLIKIRMKFFTSLALAMTLFFTALTVFIYIFNPISDCGCFGKAIHLTNGQTLLKNVFLLLLIIPQFLHRSRFFLVTLPSVEWSIAGYHTLLILALAIYAFYTNPYIEFGDFQTDTNLLRIREANDSGDTHSDNQPQVFIYEKDGIKKAFSLDDIPDTTWTFVEAAEGTDEISINSDGAATFEISDRNGIYITDSLLRSEGKIILFPVHHPDKLSGKQTAKLATAADSVLNAGFSPLILLPAPETEGGNALTSKLLDIAPSLENNIAFSDFKTLISLSRSNGGAVYLYEGIIIQKYHLSGLTPEKLLTSLRRDPDEEAAKASIRQSLMLEGFLILILLNAVLLRYICGIVHDGPKKTRK